VLIIVGSMEESSTKVIGAMLYDITGMSKKQIQEIKDKINSDILNYEKVVYTKQSDCKQITCCK
jgi:hypothetical protein